MVAGGEYPVLIDYETLIQLPPEQMPVNEKQTNTFIGMSAVSYTHLIIPAWQ